MKYFVAIWIALNIAAIAGFLVVCYKANKAHKKDQENYIDRGPKPW